MVRSSLAVSCIMGTYDMRMDNVYAKRISEEIGNSVGGVGGVALPGRDSALGTPRAAT